MHLCLIVCGWEVKLASVFPFRTSVDDHILLGKRSMILDCVFIESAIIVNNPLGPIGVLFRYHSGFRGNMTHRRTYSTSNEVLIDEIQHLIEILCGKGIIPAFDALVHVLEKNSVPGGIGKRGSVREFVREHVRELPK
jgi:hypothetical protein